MRNLSESSEGGDTRGDAQAAGTGYDVDGKFSYFTVGGETLVFVCTELLRLRFRLVVNRCASLRRQLM